MMFTKVEEIPNRGRRVNNNLREELDSFMSMQIPIVRVDLGQTEYKNHKSAGSCIRGAVRRWGFPINVITRNGVIYLERRDM